VFSTPIIPATRSLYGQLVIMKCFLRLALETRKQSPDWGHAPSHAPSHSSTSISACSYTSVMAHARREDESGIVKRGALALVQCVFVKVTFGAGATYLHSRRPAPTRLTDVLPF
jgi:hypothetical protein